MSIGLTQKIESLSPQDQREVENFVEYLHYKSVAADTQLSETEEAEIHRRLAAMRESTQTSVAAEIVFADLKAKYGR